MSLYSGIAFTGKATPPTESSASPTPSTSSIPLGSTGAPVSDQAKGSNWSAALRFAPVQRPKKKPQGSAAAHSAASLSALQNAMASHEDNVEPPSGAPRAAGAASVTAFAASHAGGATISAAPTTYSATPTAYTPTLVSAASSVSGASFKPIGRTIVAPSMTLNEDVNGFKSTTAGKRAQRNTKHKKSSKSSGARREDPSLSYHPSVVYEVGKPCDYGLYKAHVKQQRIQRRIELEERRRAEGSEGSSYYSSDEEASERDDQVAAKKARLFAPPTSYDDPPSTTLSPAAPAFTPAQSNAGPNLAAVSREETGEEAYQRRLALSAGGGGGIGARSAPPLTQPPSTYPSFTPASSTAPPAPPAGFRPPPFGRPSSADFFGDDAPAPQQPPPRPPPSFMPSQPSSYTAPSPLPSFVSASADQPTGSVSPASAPLNDAAAKAREIAARLSKLGAFSTPTVPSPSTPGGDSPAPAAAAPPASGTAEPDGRSFAERQMAAMGWQAGKGLGAQESGMTTALSVQSAASQGKKAQQKAKADGGAAPVPASGFKGRATVIDASRAARGQALVEKHGEHSRVVLLTNMVGRNEVDDDLAGEVAEEANKFGVVERCFVHVVPGEWRDEEAVRIFLVMSGLAGGWNAVQKFGGRHFGGRVVKARFYEEAAFARGEYAL